MSYPWNRPPFPAQGDESEDITYAAVGRVLTGWENIEGELSHIFALFIGKMWTNEAYDRYYYREGKRGKATQGRLNTLEEAANSYFTRSPNREMVDSFRGLLEKARGFAHRRHEVAHGIVRPINWYWPVLGEMVRPDDEGFRFCLVPPHYQRNWLKDGAPEYIYTSRELLDIAGRLYSFLQELMAFRDKHFPNHRLT